MANECGISYDQAIGMTEPFKGGFIMTRCKLPKNHSGNHYHKSKLFDRELACRNVQKKLASMLIAFVLVCIPASAEDLRPVPTTAQQKQAFSVRHPRLWKIRQACRFMLPVAQFVGAVAQVATPFVVR